MARLIAALVRHGEYQQLPDTPSAHQPFPLTAAGEQQARTAARALGDLVTDNNWQLEPQIDASFMLRAWQTASIFARELGGSADTELRVNSHEALAERSVGSAANLSIGQIETILLDDPRYAAAPPDWKADSHYRLPLQGAESLLVAGQRVEAHLRRAMAALRPASRDRLKLFVGHGAAMRHAAYHMGVLAFAQLRELSMFHCQPVLIEYRSDGTWRQLGGAWKVRAQGNDFSD